MKILVTGGAGFIGSHFVHLVLRERPDWEVVVFDKLTYAGRLENLADVANDPRFQFVRGDICDAGAVAEAMQGCRQVYNFAAETHVDRSLMAGAEGSASFVHTNVLGVHALLEAARQQGVQRFLHVSTDEVYGDVPVGESVESDALRPRSPYSASKAGGDLLAQSYYVSHGLPVIITRGSNNFGPNQYPEKVIPLFTTNALDDLPLPIYGDGLQQRDYIHAEDHCRGILLAAEAGEAGEIYNIGGDNTRTTREIAAAVLQALGKPASLVQTVADRPGHDRRYALSSDKILALGWQRRYQFEDALQQTVDWYRTHEEWWRPLKSGEAFQGYYQQNYRQRG